MTHYIQPITEAKDNDSLKPGSPGGIKVTKKEFEEYKSVILKHKPNIAHIIEQFGQMSFFDYTKSHIRQNPHKEVKKRKRELIQAFDTVIKRVLGTGVAASVAMQLRDNENISSMQHASPLGHARTLNPTLQSALPYFNSNNPAMQNLIVLSCAGISFNNVAFPKGHNFHPENSEKPVQQFTFFGHSVDSHPVMFHQGYNHESIKTVKTRLAQMVQEGTLTTDEKDKIVFLIENSYDKPHPLTFESYMDQLTLTNYYLFKKLFAYYPGKVPNLIFLSQEAIVLELLKDVHLSVNTIIHQVLFHPHAEEFLTKYFEGIQGAFSKKNLSGTYLFWAIPPGKRDKVQLWREGNFLVSKDCSYKLGLTPEAIMEAIKKKEIFPGLLLTFMVLAFYHGFSLQGGVDQTRYLSQMKEGYLALAQDLGYTESEEVARNVVTTNLVLSRPTLAFMRKNNGERVFATGFDLLLYGQGGKNWNETLEASKKITVEETLYRAFPSLYNEYVPEEEKNEKYAAFTQEDIEAFAGIDAKTPVWNNF